MLNNTSFRITNFIVVLWRDRKNRLLKTYSYDCSALKNYTTLQFSGNEMGAGGNVNNQWKCHGNGNKTM